MRQPNILWYCTDQQRFDTIGRLGNVFVNTPNLDTFADRSVAFTHAYSQSPVCTPSRASMLTGMYPSAVGVNGNGIPRFPGYMADRLIPRRFANAGYRCGLVGKLHLASAFDRREERVKDGYEHFAYSHSPKGADLPGNDYAAWLRRRGVDPRELLEDPLGKNQYRDGQNIPAFGGLHEPSEQNDNIPADLHHTHWCTEMAINFIEKSRAGTQPWFLSVNTFDPHPPFDPPFEYYRRYNPDILPGAHFRDTDLERESRMRDAGIDFQSKPRNPATLRDREIQAAYYAMIELIDCEFGRLMKYLTDVRLREETIVIFTSDHGEALGDHGLLLKGSRFHEGSVRVPLMISWAGTFAEGITSGGLVELIDLAPTLYEAAQLPVPHYLQGQSLFPALTGGGFEGKPYVRSEAYNCIDFPGATEATMYRRGDWKLVVYHGTGMSELYDLAADPWEHDDLSESRSARDIKEQLIKESFGATVSSRLPQEPRIAPY